MQEKTSYLSDYQSYLKAVGYSQSSQSQQIKALERFQNWTQKDWQQIQRKDIKNYHEYLEDRSNERLSGGLATTTIKGYLSPLASFYHYLLQHQVVTKNPLSGYPLPKQEQQSRNLLTRLEIEQLYKVCSHPKEVCLLHLYYGLGLRRSEGVALNIAQIDTKNAWVYILKGKGNKGRKIPLNQRIKQDFKEYLIHSRPIVNHPAFLLNRLSNRMQGNSANNLLKKLVDKAEIKKEISLHCLRHSIATHLLQVGLGLEQVRDYLGHAHLESTQKYIHYEQTKGILKEQLQSQFS